MFKKVLYIVSRNKWEFIAFFAIFVVLLINSVHNSYPDEFDNILGGYLINKGIIPYNGFFSHHGPVSYYFASFITLIVGQSFVKFRIFTAIFYLIFLVITYLIFKSRIKNISSSFFLIYAFVLVIASTYFWGHMFLADPISGYLMIPAYGLLFIKIYKEEILERKDLFIVSIFSFLSVLNSITYIYAVAMLLFVTFLYYFKSFKFNLNKVKEFVLIFSSPYLIFLIYLLLTSSLYNYFYDAILYNKNYYVYNYPRPAGSFTLNPIRYVIIIINNFINAYQPLMSGIKNVEFMNPFNVALALSNLVLWIFLLIKRKYLLLFLSFFILVFVTVRSNPLYSKETDYQCGVYFMLTFFNSSFIFYFVKGEINNIKDFSIKLLMSSLFVLFLVFWFYNMVFLSSELWRMTYNRYMGEWPMIYDKPQVANVINSVVPKDNYCWVGPFHFEELYYLNCKLPSKYHWILPQFKTIDKIKNEIIQDYTKNKPDIIVYNRQFSAFGSTTEYHDFFIKFLDSNYVQLKDVEPDKSHHFIVSSKDFRFDNDFNFEKTKSKQLVKSLIEKGYIK